MLNFLKYFISILNPNRLQNDQQGCNTPKAKIETDISKLIEEAAKGNKKVISPTQILICVMHAVYDSRVDLEFMNKYGLSTHKESTREESISAALAFLVCFTFENKYSPAFVISFLNKYCTINASRIFIHYYKMLAQANNIDISQTMFDDDTLAVELDIAAYAKKQSSYEHTTFDMPFREPYLSIWNSAFLEVK